MAIQDSLFPPDCGVQSSGIEEIYACFFSAWQQIEFLKSYKYNCDLPLTINTTPIFSWHKTHLTYPTLAQWIHPISQWPMVYRIFHTKGLLVIAVTTHLSRMTLTLQKFGWRPATTVTITVCSVHCQHQLLSPQLCRDMIHHLKRWTLPHVSSNACQLPIMNLKSIFGFLKKTLTLATLLPGGLVTVLNFPISRILLVMCSEFQVLHILSHYRPTFYFIFTFTRICCCSRVYFLRWPWCDLTPKSMPWTWHHMHSHGCQTAPPTCSKCNHRCNWQLI